MAVTIKDISREVGVSIATVSKVLNGNTLKVSTLTRDKILKAAADMNYRPNMLARGLVNQHINVLGIILPDIANPFYSDMARGMTDAALKRGYNAMINNTDSLHERELSSIKVMAEYNVGGILLVGNFETFEANVERIQQFRVPYVTVECYRDGQDYCVYVDNFTGSYNAVNYLIERGHRRIAYISQDDIINDLENDRTKGYMMALQDNGIEYDASLVEHGSGFIESGYQKAMQIIKRNGDVTAIACGSDLIAMGAMKAVKECGYSVPEDISLVGFDDVYFATVTEPRLTTVRQPTYEMGVCGVNMLVDRIEKKEDALKRKCFQPRLIERDSVRTLR